MAKQLRYRYSYVHGGEKKWRISAPTIATVRAFLFSNDLDSELDASLVLKALDRDGTYVCLNGFSNHIVEIDEYYVDK